MKLRSIDYDIKTWMHVKASGFMSVTGCLKQMTEEHIIKFIFDVCFVIGEKDRWSELKQNTQNKSTKHTQQTSSRTNDEEWKFQPNW